MAAMDLLGIAAQGMDRAQAEFEKAAGRIAGSNTPQQAPDTVSLSDEMVALLSAKNDFTANVRSAQVAGEMDKATLDLLA